MAVMTDQNCPACGGADLYRKRTECYEAEIVVPMECENCGATWGNSYSLGKYINLKIKRDA